MFSVRLRKSDVCGPGVMQDKGIVGLWDVQRVLLDSVDRVEERAVHAVRGRSHTQRIRPR